MFWWMKIEAGGFVMVLIYELVNFCFAVSFAVVEEDLISIRAYSLVETWQFDWCVGVLINTAGASFVH